MKILVMSMDNKSGCWLHRLLLPMWKVSQLRRDWQVDFGLKADSIEEAAEKVKEYDIVYYHKLLPDVLFNAIKEGCPNTKIVADHDDYWGLDSLHCLNFEYNMFDIPGRMKKQIARCDAITTTTDILANKIRPFNNNVYVFSNSLEEDAQQFSTKKQPSDKIRFGILCGSSHGEDMELLRGVVNQLPSDVREKAQFVLVGMDKGVNKVYDEVEKKLISETDMPWEKNIWTKFEKILSDNYSVCSKDHYDWLMQYIYKQDDMFEDGYKRIWTKDIYNYGKSYELLDVLLVPLKKTNFNENKSPLKMAEAGVTHTACIVSNVQPYSNDIIPYNLKGGEVNEEGNCWSIDNVKGTKEWVKAITKMVRNPEIITKLADNLQQYQQQTWNLTQTCEERIKLFEKIAEKND